MSSRRRKNKTWKTDKCTKQLAQIANKNAKSHSSQHKESRFDARNASRRTSPKEALAEITIEVSAEIIEDSTTETIPTADQEKCTKQLAQTAENLAKSHSSQHKESQFDAKNASAHLETKQSS